MAVSFLRLPHELLLEIFIYLNFRQLLKASLICQPINQLIYGSVGLRYIIELAIDGLVDCPNFSLPTSQRLETLLDRRQSWARLHWKRRVPIEMSGTCAAYDFAAGVLAKTTAPEDRGGRHFSSTWLPSRDDQGHEIVVPDIGLRTTKLAIDPNQDLVAFLVINDHEDFGQLVDIYPVPFQIHLRSLLTNNVHPDATLPVLHASMPMITQNFHKLAMQIFDDVIGLFIRSYRLHLYVWNWRTGEIILVRPISHTSSDPPFRAALHSLVRVHPFLGPGSRINSCCFRTQHDAEPLPCGVFDFAFLSNRAYILTCTYPVNGSIAIYSMEPPTASLMAVLKLPPHRVGLSCFSTSKYSMPCAAGPQPFTTAPESRLHYFYLEYGQFGQGVFSLFVRNRTFLKYATSGAELKEVDWEDWGRDNARFMPDYVSTEWRRSINGQRVILQPIRKGLQKIRIYDFNVNAALSEVLVIGSDMDGGFWQLVTAPTKLLHRVFDAAFESSLPYLYVERVLRDRERYTGFMIDEERVVGVQPNETGKPMPLDVFVF